MLAITLVKDALDDRTKTADKVTDGEAVAMTVLNTVGVKAALKTIVNESFTI